MSEEDNWNLLILLFYLLYMIDDSMMHDVTYYNLLLRIHLHITMHVINNVMYMYS